MATQDLLFFAMASLMLNLTPGNDMLYVASRSAGQGISAGIVSALGIMAGCLVHVAAAVAGLSAVLAKSATAFAIIKYAGAAYLIYLGIISLISLKQSPFGYSAKKSNLSYRKIFIQGAITNVLNPKVALFFLAFLPQFVDLASPSPEWRILFLGIWFDISGTLVNIAVAFLFGKLAIWMSKSPRFIQIQGRITASMLIGLGIKVAMASKK